MTASEVYQAAGENTYYRIYACKCSDYKNTVNKSGKKSIYYRIYASKYVDYKNMVDNLRTENIFHRIFACKCSDYNNMVDKSDERTTKPQGSVFLWLMPPVLAEPVLQMPLSFSPAFRETAKQRGSTTSPETTADSLTHARPPRSGTRVTGKTALSGRPSGHAASLSPSTLAIASCLLFLILVYIPRNSSAEPLKVRIHAIIPSHFAMTTELSREFHNALLNFRRDARNHKFRSLFNPEGDITFINDDTPREIMDTFCKGVLAKQATTILNINNPLGIRRRTSSNEYIVELANYLGIPMISWDSQYSGSSPTEKILQLAPTVEHQASAIFSLLERYNWTSFTIVTSQVGGDAQFVAVVESLVEMSRHKVAGNGGGAKKDSLEILSTIHIRQLADVRTALERLVGTDTRVFLLHSSSRASYDIIEIASKLGLTGKDYVWILTRSSIPTGRFGLDSFPVGLLGISFEYDLEAMKRAVRAGVKTWLQAMLDMFSRPGQVTNKTMLPQFTCESSGDPYWRQGELIYRHLLNATIRDEPHIEFNENGTLKKTELIVVNLQWHDSQKEKTEWVEVGRWIGRGLIMKDITWPSESTVPPTGKPQRAFLRVVTLNELPYVIYRLPQEDGQCEENALSCHVYQRDAKKNLISNDTVLRCCIGLSMDLLKIFSSQLNFDFVLTEVEDGKWGSINKDLNTWSGLVKSLLDNKADIAMTAMKINPERAEAVPFSVPYLETGIKIIVALREGAISPTAFLEPYDYASWSFILIFSVHATGASILIFEWLSPYGLNMGQTPKREHRFSLFRSFWLIWAMLFSTSVPTNSPKGIASRFLANIWALFALVFLASYTANLAAFMITKEEFYDLTGIKDHRLQNPYTMNPPFKYATVPNGSTEANIRANHKVMYNYMTPYNQPDVDAGIRALKTGKIQAFIYDSSVLEYYASRDPQCRLLTVGNRYAMTGYGVGFQPNLPSHWIDKFNRVILKLQETGELDRLQKFWLAGACKSTKEANLSNRTLGIINFTSAFILLGSGILLAFVILCLEHLYFIFWRKYLRELDTCHCCSLVSLSLGKSLQLYDDDGLYEDSRRGCKDPHCERQTWKLQYQLDMALMKINNLQNNLSSPDTDTQDLISAATLEHEHDLHHDNAGNFTLTANGTSRGQLNNPVLLLSAMDLKGSTQTPPSQCPQYPSRAEVEQFHGFGASSLDRRKIRIEETEDNLREEIKNKRNDHINELTKSSTDDISLSLFPLPDLEDNYLPVHEERNNSISTFRADTYFGNAYNSYSGIIGGNGNSVCDNGNSLCDNGNSLCDNGISLRDNRISPCDNSSACHDSLSYQSPVHKLRRTPSYTSAIGGSINSDLTEITPPLDHAKFDHLDGSRYSILSNSNALT